MSMSTGIRLTRLAAAAALALITLVGAACDKVPLMAPTNSTVTVSASARTLPTGGSTEVSAFVAESAGTPVQNGTTVRFTTNLGRVDPVEAQTRNGMAITTFFAGDVSGVADIKATSGSIGSASGANATTTNAIQVVVGAAAVDAVTLRASSGSVPATGGTVELIATVTGTGGSVNTTAVTGGPLSGIPVTFTTSEGTLSSTRVISDTDGQARTQLTTDRTANVTATAGTKTSNQITITRRDPVPSPTVTFTSTGAAPSLAAQLWTFAATVTGLPADGSVTAREFTWDFGDDTVLTTNSPTASHVYNVPRKVYTVTLRVVLSNGQSITAVNQIITGGF
jgi:hypothetical protein